MADSGKSLSGAVRFSTALGTSTLTALLSDVEYNIKYGIEIENWTRWALNEPSTYVKRGHRQ